MEVNGDQVEAVIADTNDTGKSVTKCTINGGEGGDANISQDTPTWDYTVWLDWSVTNPCLINMYNDLVFGQ